MKYIIVVGKFIFLLLHNSNASNNEVCQRGDGKTGECKELRRCLIEGGTAEAAGFIKPCKIPNFSEVVVCCRSSTETIVREKCRNWRRIGCEKSRPIVVGGSEAELGEFPFMAVVLRVLGQGFLEQKCGGTLISEQVVLTAAHCIRPQTEYVVRLGAHDLAEEEPESVDIRVLYHKPHPLYNEVAHKYHDIALLFLENKVNLTRRILPACLPLRRDTPEEYVVAGWGATNYRGRGATALHKARVPSAGRLECDKSHSTHEFYTVELTAGILDTMICAGGNLTDTCQGDSGGPLLRSVSIGSCSFEVVGITSFGRACNSGIPGVYTRVQSYLPWVVDSVWGDQHQIKI